MFRYLTLNTLKYGIESKIQQNIFHKISFSTNTKSTQSTTSNSMRHYIKNVGYLLGAGVAFSLAYAAYEWILRVPICPKFNRKQYININNVLLCTALLQNMNEQCSGRNPMKKIGAITGVNYKLSQVQLENSNVSSRILLNDELISQRNLFDINYISEYVETLTDLILKLDEDRRIKLLSNMIGYYVFICPECHSSLTQQIISCTSYLHKAGLQNNPVNISEIDNVKSQT
ncbi:unnamed protein product [Rotaria sp. Silwood2]|nr:unnamed protein product [Rotaria sp. Silwood2]CAF2957348.1 unnamed protein product [Rotaria sp. Silwood2]CAF3232801.1 unnamed protein product [Rotaria sp. Silwood2]CAF3331117.1 unnamed protein product [Rotaria sp. Silwood2]CAF3927400.1 unnamed protein product [Rotaria sp. Silwood2]